MADIIAKLRYFPLGPVSGAAVAIKQPDLNDIAAEHGVLITLDSIEGKNLEVGGDTVREETMDCALEEITQLVITVIAPDENSLGSSVRALISRYRAPRTVYATWGSSELGRRIVAEVLDIEDGWS